MTIDELKEKHRDILFQENDYDVENHTKLSIQFAIEILKGFDLGNNPGTQVALKINELKKLKA